MEVCSVLGRGLWGGIGGTCAPVWLLKGN